MKCCFFIIFNACPKVLAGLVVLTIACPSGVPSFLDCKSCSTLATCCSSANVVGVLVSLAVFKVASSSFAVITSCSVTAVSSKRFSIRGLLRSSAFNSEATCLASSCKGIGSSTGASSTGASSTATSVATAWGSTGLIVSSGALPASSPVSTTPTGLPLISVVGPKRPWVPPGVPYFCPPSTASLIVVVPRSIPASGASAFWSSNDVNVFTACSFSLPVYASKVLSTRSRPSGVLASTPSKALKGVEPFLIPHEVNVVGVITPVSVGKVVSKSAASDTTCFCWADLSLASAATLAWLTWLTWLASSSKSLSIVFICCCLDKRSVLGSAAGGSGSSVVGAAVGSLVNRAPGKPIALPAIYPPKKLSKYSSRASLLVMLKPACKRSKTCWAVSVMPSTVAPLVAATEEDKTFLPTEVSKDWLNICLAVSSDIFLPAAPKIFLIPGIYLKPILSNSAWGIVVAPAVNKFVSARSMLLASIWRWRLEPKNWVAETTVGATPATNPVAPNAVLPNAAITGPII